MSDVLAMGGYAVYVWPAYGLTLAVMGGLALASWRRLRARERELRALGGEPRRARRREDA